jgi:hypothetical protein
MAWAFVVSTCATLWSSGPQMVKTVDVSVEIVAPSTPGFCFVRFKTVDATGELAFR